MKKLLLIFMMTLTAMGMTSCSAKTPKSGQLSSMFSPDSTVYKSLGKSLSEILFSPTKVRVYSLKGVENIGKNDVQIEEHCVRDSLLMTLDAKQTAVLQYILLSSEDNYHKDSIMIRSPYIPIMEFEFTKRKGQVAHVVISLQDRTWKIIYDDKEQFCWNYANKDLVKKFCKYYLNRRTNKQ